MSDTPWVDTIRRETGLVEHVCKCGVGHPAWGSAHWFEINGAKGYHVHGCCGCCGAWDWIEADLREGVRIANGIIKAQLAKIKALVHDLEQAHAVLDDMRSGGDRPMMMDRWLLDGHDKDDTQ